MGLHEMNSLPTSYKLSVSLEAGKGLPKGNFRPNEGLSVDPGAVNEVVKSFNMVPLVRPDVYQ